ncbi:DUF167 domain-containing protein [Candidatus Woesearchaeota archaeon]|nr:DUF167 domain-containing protein [Candidatus Woesearchaeota archaeon]
MIADISSYIKENKLKIIVKTNSPKTEITGYDKEKEAIKLNVHAQPEKGKANLEIIKFFKKQLKKDIRIISGFKSKEKLLNID